MSPLVRFDDDEFEIPPSTPVLETLDIGLRFFEQRVDWALTHQMEAEVEDLFDLLARISLQEKLDLLFPDGHDETDPEALDRYFWPSVKSLAQLQERITPDNAIALAHRWLVDEGWSAIEIDPDWNTPGSQSLPPLNPLTVEVWFARVVESIGAYVRGWVEGATEECEPDDDAEDDESAESD